MATLVTGALGVALAALLANVPFRGRELVDVVVALPLVLPPTVLGYYLLVSLGRQSAFGRAYETLTGTSLVFTKTGAVLAAVAGALPIVVRGARAALEDVDPRLVAAARTLGAGLLRALVTVQLPLASRGIVASLLLAFARALGDFGATLLVGGNIPGETRTASIAIFDATQAGREADAGWLVLGLTALVLVVQLAVGHLSVRERRA